MTIIRLILLLSLMPRYIAFKKNMLLTWQLWPTLLQHYSFLQPYYLTPSFLLHFKSGDKSLAKKLTTKQKKNIFTHWITCVEIFHELWYKLEIILCDQYVYVVINEGIYIRYVTLRYTHSAIKSCGGFCLSDLMCFLKTSIFEVYFCIHLCNSSHLIIW